MDNIPKSKNAQIIIDLVRIGDLSNPLELDLKIFLTAKKISATEMVLSALHILNAVCDSSADGDDLVNEKLMEFACEKIMKKMNKKNPNVN